MALKGNLRDFSILQILNLVHLAEKTGVLHIESPEFLAQLAFIQGKMVYASKGNEPQSLLTLLQQRRKLSPMQVRQVQPRINGLGDMAAGLFLVNADYLTMEEISTCIEESYTEIIRDLFNLVEGFFHFDVDEQPPEYSVPVGIELENLIIEGSRHTREKEFLEEEIPSLDVALKFTERPGMDIQKVNLSVDEWKVVSYVNPQNSIKQIAKATKMKDLEIRRIVYSLVQAGLVEFVRQAGGAPAQMPTFPKPERDEQRSLVNRLIDRIRSI